MTLREYLSKNGNIFFRILLGPKFRRLRRVCWFWGTIFTVVILTNLWPVTRVWWEYGDNALNAGYILSSMIVMTGMLDYFAYDSMRDQARMWWFTYGNHVDIMDQDSMDIYEALMYQKIKGRLQ